MSLVTSPPWPTVETQAQRQDRSFYIAYGVLLALFAFVIELMRIFPPSYGAAVLVLGIVVGLAAIRPAFGLGAAIALTIIGDAVAMPWWPVAKNMSATESILYTADAVTVKPLEILLIAVLAIWFVDRRLKVDAPPIVYGPLWPPLMIFSVTLGTGLIWGLGRGGDFRAAVFEVTPLIYIPLVYLAATNLFTSLRHYHRLMTAILVALTIETVHGLIRLPAIRALIAEDASPLEHTAVLHLNLLLLMFVSMLWFGTRRPGRRGMLFAMVVPAVWLYLDAQRRAGVVALIIGGLALTIVLFTRNQTKFYRIIPLMLFLTAIYSAGFWNSESSAGFPAQAIKTIVQPDASGDKDASSDLYREIENFNLNETIRTNPLLGIGFGQQFFQPIPLPDISFFEFAPYIPHNSVLWIWTKLGIVGFVAFLYLIAFGTASGVRAAVRARDPDDASMLIVFTAYLPMMLVLAFVEITFDATTSVLLAVSLALVGSAERLGSAEGALVEPEPDPEQEQELDPELEPGTGRDHDRSAVAA